MSTMPLSVNTSVPLTGTDPGTGTGTASIRPTGFGEVWQNITVSVHCSTNVSEATCRIYVGGAASSQFFADGTTWGSTGDSSDNMPPTVPGGQSVFAQWTGGDVGATAYLVITGTRQVA
jgi:hypothetical protein